MLKLPQQCCSQHPIALTRMQMPDEAKAFLESAASSSEQQAEALNLPLSLGETKLETDKQGEPCTVYDVVFNDDALKQAKAFR